MNDEKEEAPNENGEAPKLPKRFPLEDMLAEMSDIMKFALDNSEMKIEEIPKDLNEKLLHLEKDIAKFAKISKNSSLPELLSSLQVPPEDAKELLTDAENTFIAQCELLKFEMAKKLDALREKEQEAINKGEIAPPEKVESSEEAAERRAKTFKRTSRTKNWKQL